MRKLWFLLCVLLFSALVTLSAQENLLTNPGFESGSLSNGLPTGWWWFQGLGETQVKLDPALGHNGKASARFHSDQPSKGVLVSSRFDVAPGDEIQLSAWVRADTLTRARDATFAGLAFRPADGRVTHREYFPSKLSTDWSLISGRAVVPDDVVTAELHLGYSNAPGTVWFDDVSARITSPVSFSLVAAPKPWQGEQQVTALVVNRLTNLFTGSISCVMDRRSNTVLVTVQPSSNSRIAVPINLQGTGVHNYRFALSSAPGESLRVLQGKFRTQPPLVLYPACPCYHVVGEGTGETRVEARVNLAPEQRSGLKFAVVLSDSRGRELQTTNAAVSQSGLAVVRLRVPVAAPAAFNLTARLLDSTGKELGTAQTDVHVAPRGLAQVVIGPDGFLRVDGKPEFPIGIYNCGRFGEMAAAGFNATHEYGITTGEAEEPVNPSDAELKNILDKNLAAGLRMMVELPRKAIEKANWAQVRRRLETFRNHPALLCWGSEERVARGTAPLANIAALYALVREVDPRHPLVLGDTPDVIQKLQQDRRNFFPDACMDAGIWWWYPIPLKEPDGNGVDPAATAGLLQPPSWLTTTTSKKPLWIAIQSYKKPSKEARFPTPEEYRCQAYLGIINGVKGLFFYTGYGQRDYEGKPAGLLNKPEEAHWDYVKKLAAELREFSHVIMSPPAKAALELAPHGAPIEFALRHKDNDLYLIAANKFEHPQTVHWTGGLLKGRKAEVLFETHQAWLKDDTLTDDFGALGVHVYRLGAN
jgi:hypothetical protein